VGMASGILISALLIQQCNVLHCKKNTSVKCTCKINTYKMTSGTQIPCYSNFWAQFRSGALEHHKHCFYSNDFNYCVDGSL